jgi:hypothetical protein
MIVLWLDEVFRNEFEVEGCVAYEGVFEVKM